MKKRGRKVFYLFLSLVGLFFIFALSFPVSAKAASAIKGAEYIPADDSAFGFYFKIVADANTEYEIKPEIQEVGTSFKAGYTWNFSQAKWSRYTLTYANHNRIKTDENGFYEGLLLMRSVITEDPLFFSQAKIVLRYRKFGTTTTLSLEKNVLVIPESNISYSEGIVKDNDNNPLANTIVAAKDLESDQLLAIYLTENNNIDEGYNAANTGYYKLQIPKNIDCYISHYSDIKNLFPNNLPQAEMSIERKNIFTGEVGLFSALNSFDLDGDSLTFSWDFGDGASDIGSEVEHSYSFEGQFKVVLTVCDQQGCDTSEDSVVVRSYYDKIILNEIQANPDSDNDADKWIELKNLGNFDIPLDNFRIRDKAGQSKILSGYILPASGLLVISDITFLNKTVDEEIYFYYPDSSLVSFTSYSGVFEKGCSWARAPNGSWSWTSTVTRGFNNIITAIVSGEDGDFGGNQDFQVMPIADAKKLINGKVKISGYATLRPGTLSSSYFYLEDDSSGIQVYLNNEDFPDFEIGSLLEVFGEIVLTNGETRLKVTSANDILVKNSDLKKISPVKISIPVISKEYEGSYIQVTGKVSFTSGDTFDLEDGEGNKIRVIIRSQTEIDKPKMRKGDIFTVAGILSQYRGSFRILPTKQKDVKIGYPDGESGLMLPNSGSDRTLIILLISFLIPFIPWNLLLKMKKRPLVLQKR